MIGVIDYRTGNSSSVQHALDHLGAPNALVASPADAIEQCATKFILPGVGAAGTTMDYLRAAGWDSFLTEQVMGDHVPFMGICVGLQILFDRSQEQDAQCLGWLPGRVVSFDDSQVRVPHIGWNDVRVLRENQFIGPVGSERSFYFVNSYYAVPEVQSDIVAVTEYGTSFPAAVSRGNIFATQFHAEKSGAIGLEILRRFATSGGQDAGGSESTVESPRTGEYGNA